MVVKKQEVTEEVKANTEELPNVETKINVSKKPCKCGAWKKNKDIFSEFTPNGKLYCSNCN